MDFTDVLRARQTIARYLPATPMWSYPELSRTAGAELFVKHENVQPTGAFKVRGGITLLAGMSAEQRARGVVGYSTGNHAQSLAYACRLFDAPCLIVMPESPNPTKLRAVQALGAEVDCHGADMTDAGKHAGTLAQRRGMRLVSPADEPTLIAGVATAYVEMLAAQPDLDLLVVPVGGGSGASAAGLVAATMAPHCRVVGVQSAAAPAAHDSWRAGTIVTRPCRTAVEGLATGTGFALTQQLLREYLHDFVLVSDAAINTAQSVLLGQAHTLAEGAGAAALAAVLADPSRYAGKRVGVMASGGNTSPTELRTLASID